MLDFQTQQYKLFPNIALGYSFYYAQSYIIKTYEHMYKTEFSKGNFSNVPEVWKPQWFTVLFLLTYYLYLYWAYTQRNHLVSKLKFHGGGR